MNKQIYLFVILGIIFLSMPLISAEDTAEPAFVFNQHECVELIQTCGNCTWVNITSVYYNGTKILSETITTKTETDYNKTFCDTNLIGTYTVNTRGNPDGYSNVDSYDFEVRTQGYDIAKNLVIYFLLAWALLIFSFWIGNSWIGFISSGFLVVIGVLGMIYGVYDTNDVLTRTFSFVNIGVGLYIFFVAAYEHLEDLNFLDGIFIDGTEDNQQE